jgi:hypothetical protein
MLRVRADAPGVVAVLSVLLAVAAVAFAYPQPGDSEVRSAYARLASAGVPVQVLGWIAPSAADARLTEDGGYALTLHDPGLGDVTITGSPAGQSADDGGSSLSWRGDQAVYAIRTTADTADVASRVVPLDEGSRQILGGAWDTPVLYLWYLPLVVILVVAVITRVLARPDVV